MQKSTCHPNQHIFQIYDPKGFITHFCLHVTDTKLKFTTYPLTMGQTQEMPLAISIAEQDVVKYLKQRQQETGIHYIKVCIGMCSY